jgi:chromate transporter
VQTVAVVGDAAGGLVGGLLAATVAFTPSFAFILFGAPRFGQLRGNRGTDAILGSAIPLTRALAQPWQHAVLARAAILQLALQRGVVSTLLTAAAAVAIASAAGPVLPP